MSNGEVVENKGGDVLASDNVHYVQPTVKVSVGCKWYGSVADPIIYQYADFGMLKPDPSPRPIDPSQASQAPLQGIQDDDCGK